MAELKDSIIKNLAINTSDSDHALIINNNIFKMLNNNTLDNSDSYVNISQIQNYFTNLLK